MSAAPLPLHGVLRCLLAPGTPHDRVAPGIDSVLPPAARGAPYDRKARLYDAVLGRSLASQLAWGTTNRDYLTFAACAVLQGPGGPLVDVGGGSCLWTARAYAQSPRPVVVIDRSVAMLAAGRRRLRAAPGGRHAPVTFLQADARDVPLRARCAGVVLCMGLLHVLADPHDVVAGLLRIARPGARILVSCLVARPRPPGRAVGERWVGDRCLDALRAAGEIGPPRTPAQVASLLEAAGCGAVRAETRGSWAFLAAAAPG